MKRRAATLTVAGLCMMGVPRAHAEGPNAIVVLPTATSPDGCRDTVLPPNDDGSAGLIPLPFALNFFGTSYGALYVNNNGNVTFDGPLSTYTPFPLQTTQRAIIAAFFADVDTRGVGSQPVTYSFGATTFGGQPTFCVNWSNVGYYSSHTDKLNSFQVLLVDRSDVGVGDFDIVMNYDKIQWESGDASNGSGGLGGVPGRMGYSNGATASFELPGSSVNGAFLDSNPATGLIYNSRDSVQLGRYIFPVRNGLPPGGQGISGTVYAGSVAPANVLGGAFVQVCGTDGRCAVSSSTAAGRYNAVGLAPGEYTVTAFPPGGRDLEQASIGPITLGSLPVTDADLVLAGPPVPPPGTSITNRSISPSGLPVVYWNEPLTLRTTGCAGGTATYRVLQGTTVLRSGPMSEVPPGTYSATITPLYPNSGLARVAITIACPLVTDHVTFDIYIDPSGTVRTLSGDPIPGSTVTLLRSDTASGPFETVADGSGIMSLANRRNPDVTDVVGHFGWDVIAGYYKVRAAATGCVAPGIPGQSFVESAMLDVPPAVTNLDLRLDCGAHPPLTSEMFRCEDKSALAASKSTAARAKCLAKCELTRLKGDASRSCTNPPGLDPATTACVAKADAKYRTAVSRACPAGTFPQCGRYAGEDPISYAAAQLLRGANLVDPVVVPQLLCDPSLSRCESKAVSVLGKLSGELGKCFSRCYAAAQLADDPTRQCAPASGFAGLDAQTAGCVNGAITTAAAKIAAACPTLPTCGSVYPLGVDAVVNVVAGAVGSEHQNPSTNPYCAR